MTEPTRYHCPHPILNLEKHWDGELLLYTDYATLRQLAEAVVATFNLVNERDIRLPAILEERLAELEEHLT